MPAGAGGAGGEAANGGAAVGGGGGAPAAAGGAGGAGGQQPCVGEADTDACSECCATTYSQGFSAFILTFYSCGCSGPDSCYAPCAMSLCGPNMAPKGAECVECVQEALSAGGDCDGDPGFSNCENQPSCTEYAACIQGCS